MTDQIKHECGIAMIRLLKPLEYYHVKYGSWMYGLQKLYLLMEKQHNRGQDGAGMVCMKLNNPAGTKYIHRERSNGNQPIKEIFNKVDEFAITQNGKSKERISDPKWSEDHHPFAANVYLGHLRYGTFGGNNIDFVQPLIRENNWKSRNFVLAGNFNMTNVDELFSKLIDLGQHPKEYSDTVTVLEEVGYFLDEENQFLFRKYKNEGFKNIEISPLIAENISIKKVLQESSKDWDGGYAMAGMVGHGDSFVVRDPWGIRPAYFYKDDEIVVVASERPVIQTAMHVSSESVKEIKPGYALIVKKSGKVSQEQIRVPQERKSCSFERIYFSRGSDKEIYSERKKLGKLVTPQVLKAVNNDLENTVFSFIPNTAETAFYGMIKALEDYGFDKRKEQILSCKTKITPEILDKLRTSRPRVEKIAIKDIKMRTFITEDSSRDDLVGHVYDITYGTIKEGKDNLVVIDDSIVRGTTLKRSILRILARLNPKKIVIVSSSPQIRYPDCYGIDMAKLVDFVAFRATIELLKDRKMENIINDVYKKSKEQENLPKEQVVNYVKEIYKPFTDDEISDKISSLLTPGDLKPEVKIVYQTVDNLHKACPNDLGDWYFTGNYPTSGGNKVVNKAFINFIEGKNLRAY